LVGPDRTDVLATVSAIYAVGCFFGALVAFTIGERLGRKTTIIVGTIVMTVGAILQAASYNLPMMFVGRVISG
jgi:MFS family permease